MTSVTEQDIRSTPAVLRATLARVEERQGSLTPLLVGPLLFLGCGTSHAVALAGAALYEAQRRQPAQAVMCSDYLPRSGWTHIAISRTGQTTELLRALRRAKEAGARVALLVGETGAPAAEYADVLLPLEFAPEQAVIQTRFVSAAMLALRLVIGGALARQELADLPEQVERVLAAFDPRPLAGDRHRVFLGRGWRFAVAMAMALNLQETALLVPEAHQTLEYRHGPLASADARTLVWCVDPPDEPESNAVLDDTRRTGAQVRGTAGDPLAALAEAQLLAVRLAEARGVDPDAPRHLSRGIVLLSARAGS